MNQEARSGVVRFVRAAFRWSAIAFAVLLIGSHTWASFQERGYEGGTRDFDYPAYLDFLERYNHNFIRLWVWEHAAWAQFTAEKIRFKPSPYQRSGSEAALDGQPRFDLTRLDRAYFERLRARVEQAGERGIYVSVMLFQGFSIELLVTQDGASLDDLEVRPVIVLK